MDPAPDPRPCATASGRPRLHSRTLGTHATRHTGRGVVLRIDLRDFFASVSAGRVYETFTTLGYSPAVSHALTGLCTNVVPAAVWEKVRSAGADRSARAAGPVGAGAAGAAEVQAWFWLGRSLATPHLPQGAPTSPALANLAAFRLDRRLTGLASRFDAEYSRYADDLTFSGADLRGLPAAVEAVVRDEGFAPNPRKTVIRRSARRQSVCGIVVNVHPNAARPEYDRLRAILHDAAAHGTARANRAGVDHFEEHLRGRVAWVAALNPARGRKLAAMLDAIDWDRPSGVTVRSDRPR
jgi:RNA-directed DNA polymerase